MLAVALVPVALAATTGGKGTVALVAVGSTPTIAAIVASAAFARRATPPPSDPSYLDGLARKPLIGFLLRRIGCQFVERANREHGIADTRRLEGIAARGQTLVFFSEGGPSRMPGLRPFRLGAFVVAATTGRPVVPVAIRGTRSMLRADHRFVRRGAIHVTVGEPILPPGIDWDAAVELERAARDAILRHCGEPDVA